MRTLTMGRAVLAIPGVALLLSCGEFDRNTRPTAEPTSPADRSVSGVRFLDCPGSTAALARAKVGSAGGKLKADGHQISIPAGAVPAEQEFTIEVRATSHLQVDFRADGHEEYAFQEPVTLTLSYESCGIGSVADPLRVYHVDPTTSEILEDLGGTHDPAARTVSAQTDHLSDYAVGTPY